MKELLSLCIRDAETYEFIRRDFIKILLFVFDYVVMIMLNSNF